MNLVIGRPVITVELARAETLSLDDARGVCITAYSGVLWVTQERRRADHFVCAGTPLVVSEAGRTVVEALERARLQLSVIGQESARPARFVQPIAFTRREPCVPPSAGRARRALMRVEGLRPSFADDPIRRSVVQRGVASVAQPPRSKRCT
jgi:hypothetical protein